MHVIKSDYECNCHEYHKCGNKIKVGDACLVFYGEIVAIRCVKCGIDFLNKKINEWKGKIDEAKLLLERLEAECK